MALDPNYGNRIRGYAEQAYPQAFAAPPPLTITQPEPVQLPQQQMPQAASGNAGFPGLVAKEQGAGPKLDAAKLEALKERYLIETVMPRETARKGSDKAAHDAAQAAYTSKADRWIQDYLKEAGAVASEGAADNGRGYVKGTAQGTWDTFVSAVKGLSTDTLSGLGNLADYGLRKVKGDVGGGTTALMELLGGGSTADAINKGAAVSNRLAGENTFLGRGSDAVSEFGSRVADEFTSEATLKARRGLADLLAQDAPAGQIAAYIASNPSSATGYLGETIGMIAPALFTGGATAAARGSALAGNLAKGGALSRVAGRAVENAPAILAAGAAPTGNAVGDLRQAINEAPLGSLLESQGNKALYESLQDMGLTGERLNTRFREALFVKAQDVTLAGAAASNVLFPGVLGAPAERALANIVTRGAGGNVLRRVAKTATGEGAQEALSAIPDTLSQNIAQSQYTGNEVPIAQGLANNALLSAGLGAIVGGGAAIPSNPLRRTPVAPPVEAATEQTPPTVEPTAVTPAAEQSPTGPVSIMDAPGTGIGEAASTALAKQTVEAAALATARKAGKQAIQKLDAAGVISQAQSIAEQTAGQQWSAMTSAERLDIVESAAETLNKQAKKEEVAPTLAALRSTLTQPTVTPAGSVPEAVSTPAPVAPETPPAAPVSVSAAPVAPTAPDAQPSAAPAVVEPQTPAVEPPPPATSASPALPAALAGAKPRWNNGAAAYAPQFESDVDKAFYIIGQTTKSKNDAAYRQFLEAQGFPTERLDELAKTIRASVRFYMEQSPPGTNTTPAKVTMPATNVLDEANKQPVAKKANALKAAPKTKDAPPKTNKLKKAAPPPKTEAPAKPPGQAAPAAPEQIETAARESGIDAVSRIAPELSKFDKSELTGAIELARQGDNQLLNNVTSGLQRTGDISRAQAIALRKEGEALSPSQEGLTTTEAIELATPKGRSSSDAILNNGLVLGRAVQTALKSNSKTKVGDVLRAFDTAKNDVGPMQAWLAKKLAPIVDKLGVNLLEVPDNYKHAAGAYEFTENGIWIRQPVPEIILHEALHGVTSSLLAVNAKTPEARKFQQEFGDLLAHVQTYVRENPDAIANDWLSKQVENQQGFLSNTRELLAYGMTNGRIQDFLATIPAPDSRKKATNAWQEFKNILARLFESLAGKMTPQQRSALDALIESTAGLVEYAGLNPVEAKVAQLNASKRVIEARSKTADEIDEDAIDFATVDPQQPSTVNLNADVRPVSIAQRLGELFSQAAYGLERSEQEVRKVGGEVTPENSPYYASRKYTSDIAENRNTDNMEVVQPIENWIATNWRDFKSATLDAFRTDLDKFLQNYHSLNERNPSIWANTVELKNGMELQRAKLVDDAYEGKMTGPELNTALIKLAEKNAAEPLETWAASNAARDPKRARDVLADVAKRGFTPDKLKAFNELLQTARDRSRERMDASGVTSPEDPFADRGWVWYVPLKGSLATSETAADFDIGSRKGSAKEFRQRNLRTLEGRSTNADNALEQLIVDMNEAASAQAESEFKSTLFEYVSDNLKTLGAKIRRWEGTPKQGYTTQVTYTKKGKEKIKERYRRELPNPKSGFIYNDGLNHYEVTLPEGSQLDRGLKGIRSIATPATFEESNRPIAAGFRALGTATNILARNYTTWSPTWQLTTAFLRDVNALPLTVAIEAFDSPWKARLFAAQYAKNILSNTLDLRNALAELKAVNGDKSAMAKYAESKPNSYVAKLLKYREAGGSTEFSQGLNRTKAGELLFDKARRQDADLISLGTAKSGYNKWNELTGNWAAMLENKGRVAAWEALQSTGMDSKQAAAIVKGALDYGQSGEWGKLINIVHAFYRIGATSVDTMRRAFSKPDGSVDIAKASKWIPVIGAMGAMSYMLLGAMLGDDEDGVPKIKKITADTLTQKFVLPDGNGDVISVPIGLGLPQLMLAPGILGAAVASGNITSEEAAKAYYETITRNTPIQPGGVRKGSGATGFVQSWLQGILVPSVAMPISESVANTNAFDSPIRTDFPNKNKYASDQGMPDTPGFWKDVARTTREVAGIDMYPETLRHFVKGWGGQPANNVIRWTLDFDNKEQQGMDSRAVRTALRLGVSDADFYYRNEARKALEELTLSKRNLNSALKNGEDETKWLRANPNDAKRIAAYKALDSARDAYYKRKAAIRDNKLMTPQGKKEQLKLADSKLREAVNKAQTLIENTED